MKFFVFIWAIMLVACTSTQNEMGQIQGSVAYRERIAVPLGAKLDIQLVDISIADAPAKVIAHKQINMATQVPIPFVLDYPKREIKEGMTYSVSARITDAGKLLFISDRVTPVLTRGQGSQAHLILVKVRP
jgi:putative lipoprotein